MAEKKALLILAESSDLNGTGAGARKLLKKAVVASNYAAGAVLDGSVPAEVLTRVQPAAVAELVEKGEACMVLDLNNADAAAFDAALDTALGAIDRRTIVAVVGKESVAFYGLGIARPCTIDRSVKAGDILTTLSFVADLPLTETCTGAVIYQALKSPNIKLEEIAKLKEALVRMEGALARDNREPWDKHDCA